MSKILYVRIDDELWQAIAKEARDTDTSMVRTAIRCLRRGVLAGQDQLKG